MQKYIKVMIWFFIILCLCWLGYDYIVISGCRDLGGLFDEKTKTCRYDCLAISKQNGCIKMTASQVDISLKQDRISAQMGDEICLNNDLPIHKVTKECDIEFHVDDCESLDENVWIIPDRCLNFRKN